MMEQLALAQQIELLQQQQQQIAATHQQYVNLGMIQPQQQLPNQTYNQVQGHLSPPTNNFQFPQQQFAQQPMGMPMGTQPQQQAAGHRRNQSAMPNMTMGPPPAPSAGSSGPGFGDFSFPGGPKAENVNPRARGGSTSNTSGGSGHARRHSLALPEAKKAAEIAEQKRKNSGFQFPIPNAGGAGGAGGASPAPSNRSLSPATAEANNTASNNQAGRTRGGAAHGRSQSMAVGNGVRGNFRGGPVGFQFPPPMATTDGGSSQQTELGRRGSQGHGRAQSRNFDGNWRQQQTPTIQEQQGQNMGNFQMNQHTGAQPFQPSHRNRNSVGHQSMSALGGFQFPAQPQLVQLPQGQMLMQPNMLAGQTFNPLQMAQIRADRKSVV